MRYTFLALILLVSLMPNRAVTEERTQTFDRDPARRLGALRAAIA